MGSKDAHIIHRIDASVIRLVLSIAIVPSPPSSPHSPPIRIRLLLPPFCRPSDSRICPYRQLCRRRRTQDLHSVPRRIDKIARSSIPLSHRS
jgi:hypothetical protein